MEYIIRMSFFLQGKCVWGLMSFANLCIQQRKLHTLLILLLLQFKSLHSFLPRVGIKFKPIWGSPVCCWERECVGSNRLLLLLLVVILIIRLLSGRLDHFTDFILFLCVWNGNKDALLSVKELHQQRDFQDVPKEKPKPVPLIQGPAAGEGLSDP